MIKKIFILFLILSLCFCLTVFGATNSTNSSENSVETNSIENTNSSTNTEESEETSNEVYSTSYSADEEEIEDDDEESETINSYTTVSSVSEANLGLNNVLNIILIAFGILMILLGIAILIKLKN